MRVRRRALVPALGAIAVAVAGGAIANASAVTVAVRASATCATQRVPVRLVDGSVVVVRHARPGRTIRQVSGSTRNLFLVVRLHAPWRTVQAGAGTTTVVDAAGPNGEAWRWTFHLRNAHPLADPTDYVVCLRPKTASGSFAAHMHGAPGAWTFTVSVTAGRLSGSTGQLALPAV